MSTLAHLADDTGKPFSLARYQQMQGQLEAAFAALFGCGVLSGGIVSVVSGLQVKVPSGTKLFCEGVVLVLAADATFTLPGSTTGTLYGLIQRTKQPDDVGHVLLADTYALSFTTSSPTAQHFKLSDFVTGVSSVTSLSEPASGKYVLPQHRRQARTLTATGTISTDDSVIFADATAGAIVLTLPAASAALREVRVMKVDSSGNTVTVQRAGSDTINGATTSVLSTQYAGKAYASDGAAFWGAF